MIDYRKILYSNYRTTQYENSNPESLTAELIELYDLDYAAWLPTNKDAKILDLGCGSGFLLNYLKTKGYNNVFGADTSQEQVEFSRKSGLNVQLADAVSFLSNNSGYDLIFITDMIEHLHKGELLELFIEVNKTLNSNGEVIIRTVNASSIAGSTTRYIDLTHELSFTEVSLKQLFNATGYEAVTIADTQIPFGLKPKRFARWFLAAIWRSIFNMVLYIELGSSRPKKLGKFLIAKAAKSI